MARIVWTERALDDLEKLLEYIARDAPVTARRFAQKMISRLELLQEHPRLVVKFQKTTATLTARYCKAPTE